MPDNGAAIYLCQTPKGLPTPANFWGIHWFAQLPRSGLKTKPSRPQANSRVAFALNYRSFMLGAILKNGGGSEWAVCFISTSYLRGGPEIYHFKHTLTHMQSTCIGIALKTFDEHFSTVAHLSTRKPAPHADWGISIASPLI